MRYPNWLKVARLARSRAIGREITQEEIGKYVNASQSAVQKWEAGLRKLPLDVAAKLAPLLEVTREYLLFGPEGGLQKGNVQFERISTHVDRPIPIRHKANVVGTVGAGGWLEVDELPGSIKTVPAIPGEYENIEQWAYRVVGNSMDQAGITDGCYVICIQESNPRNGERVVIERRRGQLFQRSVKEYRQSGDVIELIPRSSDPSFRPLRLDRRDMREDEDTEIKIVGRVIAAFNFM